jgi:hypothetical protein
LGLGTGDFWRWKIPWRHILWEKIMSLVGPMSLLWLEVIQVEMFTEILSVIQKRFGWSCGSGKPFLEVVTKAIWMRPPTSVESMLT